MANFLGNLGAAFQGQQNYQTYLDQREAAKLKIEADKANLAQIQDLSDQAKQQRQRQSQVDKSTLDYLAQFGQGVQGIGSPPQTGQPPTPGQPSLRMMQPQQTQQYPPVQRSIGPPSQLPPQGAQQGGPPQGMPPQGPPQGMPPGGPQQQMPQGMPQQGMQRPSMPPQGQIPPYQTVRPQMPPQQQQGIPPPPQQANAQPPGQMSIQDAAKFIKDQGISDPTTAMQILDKLTPYLNNDARQEAASLKTQMDQQNKVQALQEKAREADKAFEDRKLSVSERQSAAAAANQTRQMLGVMMGNIAQQNANTRSSTLKNKIAAGGILNKDDYDLIADQVLAGDKSVLTGLGRDPKAIASIRSAVTRKAKEQGITGAQLAATTAEFAGLISGEKTLATKTANIGMAGNEAKTFAQNALDASEKVDRTQFPDLNKILISGEKRIGNPDVVAFGSYNNSLINAYARAVSPSGTPTVSDKDHAREILETNFSKGQYKAGVDVIMKEIDAAKQAPGQTAQELRNLAIGRPRDTAQVGGQTAQPGALVFSNQAELKAAIAAGKVKKGDTFTDPSGNPHTVN